MKCCAIRNSAQSMFLSSSSCTFNHQKLDVFETNWKLQVPCDDIFLLVIFFQGFISIIGNLASYKTTKSIKSWWEVKIRVAYSQLAKQQQTFQVICEIYIILKNRRNNLEETLLIGNNDSLESTIIDKARSRCLDNTVAYSSTSFSQQPATLTGPGNDDASVTGIECVQVRTHCKYTARQQNIMPE